MAAALLTEFAPAERSPAEEIARQRRYFAGQPFFEEILQFVPDPVLIVNRNRQIVYANRAFLAMAGSTEITGLVSLRPGEAMGCRHARKAAARCGTTRCCRSCGMTRAILQGQSGRDAVEECRLTVQRDGAEEALDLRVWAHPTEWRHERFTLLALTNIADEKRRAFLERIFQIGRAHV